MEAGTKFGKIGIDLDVSTVNGLLHIVQLLCCILYVLYVCQFYCVSLNF